MYGITCVYANAKDDYMRLLESNVVTEIIAHGHTRQQTPHSHKQGEPMALDVYRFELLCNRVINPE